MRFLCRIGIHKWGYWIDTSNALDSSAYYYDFVRSCMCCGYRQGTGHGATRMIEERLRKNAEDWNDYQKKAKQK